MSTSVRPRSNPNPRPSLEFFKGFLRNPREVASVIPSSRFLTRRVLECGEVATAKVIIELGPGTGVLTQRILARMPKDAKLIAVEINRDFADLLEKQFPDPRFTVFHGCATDLENALAKADASMADLVVSGIPFSTLERGVGCATAEAARRVLSDNGRFVAYQFRSHVARIADPVFGPAETHSGFWNIPPMKIYVWRREPVAS